MQSPVERLPVTYARTLLLGAQGLLNNPSRRAGPISTLREIERLGFVQLDSINIVERAHHHIVWTRLHDYRPRALDILQRSGRVFEHWTHDASVIPAQWFPHWRHRFASVAWGSWLRSRIGPDHQTVVSAVIDRIRREGPLMARDFAHTGARSGPWWDWKPAKAALEYAWRRGDLAIPRRVRFEKVYDLTDRVLPHVCTIDAPNRDAHTDWACRTALDRLGVATPRELALFWNFFKAPQAAAWCVAAARRGEIVPVRLDSDSHSKSRLSYAPADWRRRLDALPAAPDTTRLLSPFDPVLRDRARCLRLMNFDYRFEAFVPEPKRRYGYYVLPVLDRDRFVARLDPKLDRDAGVLYIRNVWWEPKVKVTPALRRRLDDALQRYAAFAGAGRVEGLTSAKRPAPGRQPA